MNKTMVAALAALIAAGTLAGCVVEPRGRAVIRDDGVVVAVRAPPPVRAEVVPPPPYARAVWDPGHWNWNGGDYVWVGGHYVDRPQPNMRWQPGRWESRNG